MALDAIELPYAYLAALLVEDEVTAVEETGDWGQLPGIVALSPLLVIHAHTASASSMFRVHAVLRESLLRRGAVVLSDAERADLRGRALSYLMNVGAYARMPALLQAGCSPDELVDWSKRCGHMIMRFAGSGDMMRVLRRLPASVLSSEPQLLLLRASLLRDQEDFEEAQHSARLAAELAEAQGESKTVCSALLLTARLALDAHCFEAARTTLLELERSRELLDADALRLVHAYMAAVESHQGNSKEAVVRAQLALATLSTSRDLVSAEAALTLNCLAGVEALSAGRWSVAARYLALVAHRRDLPAGHRVSIRANLASCQVELGCLGEAAKRLDEVIQETEIAGLRQLSACAYGTRSALRIASGDVDAGLADQAKSHSMLEHRCDELLLLGELITSAVTRRAIGLREDALAQCERAKMLSDVLNPSVALYEVMVSLETAASHLSLSDIWGARKAAQEVRSSLTDSGAMGHLLRADLILAEADRLEGDITAATLRLSEHADYIATGSANWLIAMYVRAFPGLLGVLTQAIGAEALPLRMLLMVPLETLATAIELAPHLTEEERRILLRRRGAEAEEPEHGVPTPSASAVEYSCYARLFGGLEVTTKAGVVNEEDWRKRKARLLFLALLLKQHQDVPRDVILERLWPDMDEEHAKRNFYVTWSTMKRALACGGVPADAKSFVQCSGGV
ncbi:hypothetical protein EG829_13215, partial [bacterium]|nr:hypothetical protein [bacterium]